MGVRERGGERGREGGERGRGRERGRGEEKGKGVKGQDEGTREQQESVNMNNTAQQTGNKVYSKLIPTASLMCPANWVITHNLIHHLFSAFTIQRPLKALTKPHPEPFS